MNAFAMIGKVKSKFKYYVIKNFETEKIQFYDIGVKPLNYEENLPNIPWNIQAETKNFGNITCQKATATLYGRNWTAWFAKEITINDGPYKFGGLPGLIINIYDEKQDYNFLMVKNTKEEVLINLETVRSPIKFASKEKFLKAKRGYDENPLQSADAIGLQLTEEMKRDVMKRVKNRLKTENNPFELKP
jgi:GLPGLI family protein